MSFKPINKYDENLDKELEDLLKEDSENGDERPENPMGETLLLWKRKMKSSNVSCKPFECRNFMPPPPPPPTFAIAASAGGKRKKSKNNRKYKNKNRKRFQTKRIKKRNKKV
jgi:hypothetical protein